MQKIKNFSIFKHKPSENEKAPTHFMSAKVGEEHVRIANLWTKENQYGKYLSGQLQEAWVDKNSGKSREAFVIVPLNELQALLDELSARKGTNLPITPTSPLTSETLEGGRIDTSKQVF